MKKSSLFLTKVLYLLFIIGTVFAFYIIYKDLSGQLVSIFLFAYLWFTCFAFFYTFVITIINLRNVEPSIIKKKFLILLILFVLFVSISCLASYFFKSFTLNFARTIALPFGMAFGITFDDINLIKKES